MKACYKYFSLLRGSELSEQAQDEIKDISALAFRFAEKGSPDTYATRLSGLLKRPIPRSLLLSGPSLTWDWDSELVRDTLDQLSVENSRVFVMSKDPRMDEFVDTWSSEPWYGTQHSVRRLDAEILAAVRFNLFDIITQSSSLYFFPYRLATRMTCLNCSFRERTCLFPRT